MVEIDGVPALRRTAWSALNSRACETIVSLCKDQVERMAVVEDLPIKLVALGAPSRGMSGSIKAGISAVANNASGAVILLPDMPEIESSDINALIDAFGTSLIVRAASEDGRPGNPVLFPRSLFPDLYELKGADGAKSVVVKHVANVRDLRLPGTRALLDLDTPEEWENWIQHRWQRT